MSGTPNGIEDSATWQSGRRTFKAVRMWRVDRDCREEQHREAGEMDKAPRAGALVLAWGRKRDLPQELTAGNKGQFQRGPRQDTGMRGTAPPCPHPHAPASRMMREPVKGAVRKHSDRAPT